MDKQRARELLTRYTPGAEKHDPQMAAALALARSDSQLAAWFATHSAAQAIAAADAATRKKPVRNPVIPLNRWALLMIVMALLVLALSYFWPRLFPEVKNEYPAYRDRMARLVQRTFPMQVLLTNQTEIRAYLRGHDSEADFTLPHALQTLPAKGVAAMTWHQQPVSLIALDSPSAPDLYLFVTRRDPFIQTTVPTNRAFARVGRVMTVTWLDNGDLFLLTGPTDEKTLSDFLEQP